eukprot:881807-Rhodomonas_salina.3
MVCFVSTKVPHSQYRASHTLSQDRTSRSKPGRDLAPQPYAMSVPDFSCRVRREIAAYAMPVPDFAYRVRREIGYLSVSCPPCRLGP